MNDGANFARFSLCAVHRSSSFGSSQRSRPAPMHYSNSRPTNVWTPDPIRRCTRGPPSLLPRAFAHCYHAGSMSRTNAQKTHCPRGHPYAGDNLIVQDDGRYRKRACRACMRAAQQRWYAHRSQGRGTPQSRTHCPQGHPYAGDNLYVAPNGERYCRACGREKNRRWKAKQRAAARLGAAPVIQ
jgi:hypothetical protein